MFQPGEVFDGKFRVERLLGQGGMGVVMVATHLALDQKVAIKVLHDRVATDASVIERLQREARAAARLRSEHVCRVSDVGTVDGTPYIVMELLDGADLASVIARGVLPVATAVDYVLQACVAIAEAHALGIIHRDLKPANLFVTRRLDGSALIKVLDFGIAKAQSNSSGVALTQTETMMGTPGYMSPEQLRSARDVDGRTDIWALGCILYQAVSGRLPFPATSITEVAVKIAMDPPDPLDDVDPAFRVVVFRCLEKEPAKRPRDIAELAAALVPFGGPTAAANAALITRLLAPATDATLPATAPSSIAATVATAAPGNPTTTLEGAAGQPAGAKSRRGRAALIVGAALAVLGIGAAGWSVIRTQHAQRPVPMTTPPTTTTTTTIASIPAEDAAVSLDAAIYAEAPVDAAQPNATTTRAKTTTKATPKRTIEDDLHDAQDDMWDANYEDALRLAKSILARDPGNRAARHVGVSAACSLRDATTARELAAPLPQENRDKLGKLCDGGHISLEPAEPTAKTTAATAQVEADVDRAIARHRCIEASRIANTLKNTQDPAVQRIVGKADACLQQRTEIMRNPQDPTAEPWFVTEIAELREQGLENDASTIENGYYSGRMIDACKAGDAAAARAAAAKTPACKLKDNATTFCKGQNIDVR